MQFSKKDIFTIPNIITYFRLLCVPVFIAMFFINIPYNLMWAFGIFIIASISDLADGFIARKFHMISDIGKVTDPLADKLLQVSALVCLTIVGCVHFAFAIILLVKEALMILGSIVFMKYKDKITIQSNFWGKIAAACVALGVTMSFFHYELVSAGVGIGEYTLDWMVLTIAMVLAIVALIQYAYNITMTLKKALNEEKENNAQKDEESK